MVLGKYCLKFTFLAGTALLVICFWMRYIIRMLKVRRRKVNHTLEADNLKETAAVRDPSDSADLGTLGSTPRTLSLSCPLKLGLPSLEHDLRFDGLASSLNRSPGKPGTISPS
jgi:hypothetical protein